MSPHVIVSSTFAVPTEQTIAIHPLGTSPLQSSHGKKMVARELGAWRGGQRGGAGGAWYYPGRAREPPPPPPPGAPAAAPWPVVPAAERDKYVMIDAGPLGGVTLNERGVYHNHRYFRALLSLAATVALATGRVLLLPRVVFDYHM